jgi:hypothetical protein
MMSGDRRWRAAARLAAALAASVWAAQAWPEPMRAMTVAEFRARTAMDPGDLMYRQSYAVARGLEAMQPQTPGKTDLYYIGFAADAQEKVFTHDVELAQKRLASYGAAGHGMLLLNNVDHAYDAPIANAANLEAAIKGIAARMDPREDVLFLFLSSHGAPDATLWVNYPPLQLSDLRGEELKRMLDESGIRYRVVVVAACYSGAFVDALKDDNTLVLTASSADHVAYGCGDYTRYTEFTEAYFGASLLNGASFIDAFLKAGALIAKEEKASGDSPSRPQIYIGRNIAPVLQKLAITPRIPGPQDLARANLSRSTRCPRAIPAGRQ